MKLPLALLSLVLAIAAPSALAEDAAGKWTGKLTRNFVDPPVPITVTIVKDADGNFTGNAAAPNGSVALNNVASDGATLSFELPDTARCHMEWDPSTKSWVGVLTQNGVEALIELKRAG